MSKRKILSLLLAVVMICSLFASPALAAEDAGEPVAIADKLDIKFTDADGHWAESAIYRWAEAGIVQGDGDGTVNPARGLRRCELAAVLSRLLGLKATAPAGTFSDVANGIWYADPVLKCAAAGIMLGDGAGRANPENTIDRQQAIVMIARALGVKPSTSNSLDYFEDGDTVADWAAPYMAALTDMGILNGLPAGDGFVVAPADDINRAAIFVLLDKAIAEYVTTPTTVNVNDANKFVVINADAAETVTVTGTTAGIVVAAGTTADVTLDRAAVGTLKVDAPVDVTISRASTVTDLDANAAAQVENNGTVTNLNTNADDVTFDGNKPAAVNTAEDVEPAKDSKGVEVTPAAASTDNTGSSGSRPSSTTRADIVAATIADHADADKAIAAEDLGKVTVTSSKVSGKTNEYNVTITGTNIMNHTNADGNPGHWVGFGMPAAPEGEEYTFKMDGVAKDKIKERTQETNGKTYHTAYFSAATEEEFNAAKVVMTVENSAGEVVMTYNVSFKVTFWSAKNVKVVATGADAETAIKALEETTSMPWAHKFADGLGLTAAVKNTIVTLTGNTTKAALQNTDTGADDGYLTYILQVTDDVIKSFKVDNENAAPDELGLNGITLVVNQKIYDNTAKELLANDVTFELVDAANRVQDSVTVTVDGTGVSIEGMKKVTFKDGDKVLKSVVGEVNDPVTAPEFPANTDTVYYTGAWLNEAGEVATAPFTVGDADATYTAKSVPVTATTLSVRANGPEGGHEPVVENFEYSKVYTAAGLSMKGSKITVDATKLIAMVNSEDDATAKNLAHIKGNGTLANDVVFGVAYKTPTGAKKVAFAADVEGLASATNYRELATHPSCYDNTLISYISVATIAADKTVTFMEDGEADSDYCKWVDDDNNIVAVTKTVIEIETTNMPTFTVTYKDEKGTQIEKVEIPYGKADWELSHSIPAKAIPDGYSWDGKWYTKNGDEYTEYTETAVLGANLELIARFEPTTYEFYTDVNGGTVGYVVAGDDFTVEDKQPVTEGTLKTLPQAHGMKRPGFEFVCWRSQDGKLTFESGEIISGKADTIDKLISLADYSHVVRLVAEWKPVATITALDKAAIEKVLVGSWATGLNAENMVITLDTENATEKDGVITISASGALTPYKYAGFGAGVDKNQSFVVLAIEKPEFTNAYIGNTDWKVTDVVVRTGIDTTAEAYALKHVHFADKLEDGADAKDYAVIVMLVGNEEETAKTIDIWVDWAGMAGDEVTGTHYVIDLSGVTFKAAETPIVTPELDENEENA